MNEEIKATRSLRSQIEDVADAYVDMLIEKIKARELSMLEANDSIRILHHLVQMDQTLRQSESIPAPLTGIEIVKAFHQGMMDSLSEPAQDLTSKFSKTK